MKKSTPKPKKTPPVLSDHEFKMATDREYAERYIKSTMPTGRVFTVTLEAVDPIATQELFRAVESLKFEKPELVAGCKVHNIFHTDMVAEHLVLKQRLAQLASL